MDSPIHIGDTTTNSILHRLQNTHINSVASASISAASYSGEQVIQLDITFKNEPDPSTNSNLNSSLKTKSNAVGTSKINSELPVVSSTPADRNESVVNLSPTITIVRRVQDSYINISQLFEILIKLSIFDRFQINKFLTNEIINNPQYLPTRGYDDFRNHENIALRGIWIPYDKAVSLAIKFDVYEFVKTLFLVDVHEYDNLPKAVVSSKRALFDAASFDGGNAGLMGSPTKKQKRASSIKNATSATGTVKTTANMDKFENPNAPFTLPPQNARENQALVSEIKLKYSEVFKKDDASPLSFEEVKKHFEPILSKYSSQPQYFADLPLDQQGKTALHFASTLASTSLVGSFIKLGLCSPIRGTIVTGQSPLVSTITVTNAMEKGNFRDLLSNWLHPAIWLLDKNKWSIFHYLAFQSLKQFECTKYYIIQILEWVLSGERISQKVSKLILLIINLQDEGNGNTCLHLAAENESKWLINILIELNANVEIKNKTDLKPIDYDIVKEVIKERELNTIEYETEQENYLIELIKSNVEVVKRKVDLGITIEDENEFEFDEEVPSIPETVSKQVVGESSRKIFQTIQNLLLNTNKEYESLIKQKKQQLNKLNEKVHDISIVTANNRFISKKINEKLIYLDNIKLQMGNISDKLEISKREVPEVEIVEGGNDENIKYDADEPFRIGFIYDQLLANGGNIEDIKYDESIIKELPSLPILKARLKAYETINSNIENELSNLTDYSELTSKFKKVVSFCTGVDINEVDDLLDGLLEAVEGQQ